jgi:hypothetical protein
MPNLKWAAVDLKAALVRQEENLALIRAELTDHEGRPPKQPSLA